MKRTIFILLSLWLFACENIPHKEQNLEVDSLRIDTDTTHETEPADEHQKVDEDVTFVVDFSSWIMDEIDLSSYPLLQRKGDTLSIDVKDTTIVIVDEYYDEEEHNYMTSNFIVAHVYPEHDLLELQASAYEYGYHVYVDLHTGDSILTYGQPLFSKDGAYIFTSNVDLEAGFDDNGYQLIRKDTHGFTLIKEVNLNDWGIRKASWLGTDSIIFEKVTLDEDLNLQPELGKMKIK